MTRRVDLPTGRVTVPDWCKGAHIDWHDGYSSAPSLLLKVQGEVSHWTAQNWRYVETGHWLTVHADGRSLRYAHTDQLTLGGDGFYNTPQHGGLSGSSVLIWSDGRRVRLNGPWCNGPASGYHETTVVNGKKWSRDAWHEGFRCVGPDISTDLLLRIVARFLPHLEAWADCDQYGYMQVAKAEWGMPKAQWMRTQNVDD